MGYLFLALALFAGTTKGYCGKKTSGYLSGLRDSLFASSLRMLLCILTGLAAVFLDGSAAQLYPTGKLLLICALSGISTAVFVVSWLLAVKKSAYMLVDIFLMLGVLIPILGGSLFFREQVPPVKWLGIAVLFAAVTLMCSYNRSFKGKLSLLSWLLLLLCGFSSGIADFSQKLYVYQLPGISAAVFNFYTYVFAGLAMVAACLLFRRKDGPKKPEHLSGILGYIAVMALCLFANSYFKTLAAARLDSVLMYPLNQGAALILSSAMASLLFREKLTAKAVAGIALAFVGLILIHLL